MQKGEVAAVLPQVHQIERRLLGRATGALTPGATSTLRYPQKSPVDT